MNSSKRSFKIVDVSRNTKNVDYHSGTYHGNPMQAARKAFNQFCRKSNMKQCELDFTIQEITRGSSKKTFSYHGSRKPLNTPKTIQRNGTTYTIEYETTVKRSS